MTTAGEMWRLLDTLPTKDNTLIDIRQIVELFTSLLSDSYCLDELTLKYVMQFFDHNAYRNLLAARNANHRCGYPLCSNQLQRDGTSHHHHHHQYGKNSYALQAQFCGDYHSDCSGYLEAQLPDQLQYRLNFISLNNCIPATEYTSGVIPLEEVLRGRKTAYDIDSIVDDMKSFNIR